MFQAILANATRLCEASFGSLLLSEGDTFRRAALHNAPPTYVEFSEKEPVVSRHRAPGLNRLAQTRQAAQVADMAAERPDAPITKFGGARTLLIVPDAQGK